LAVLARSLATLLLLTAACSSSPGGITRDPPAPSTGVQAEVERAADLEGVPRALLVAIGWIDSRLSMNGGQPSRDGGFGVFHLLDERLTTVNEARARLTLQRAAALTGLSLERLQTDAASNARGGAAILRAELDRMLAAYPDLHEEQLGDWYQPVMRLAGSDDARLSDAYAAQVYRLLREGLSAQAAAGPVRIVAQEFTLSGKAIWGELSQDLSGEYCPSGACVAFVPASTSNYAASRGVAVTTVVIHDMEGSYSSAMSWFQNPSAQASAHYLIRSSDGQITQMVHDADTAWHSGNSSVNHQSVGIEHEGFAHDGATWFTEAMYKSSAALTRWLTDTYGIPRDRAHIIGHYEVPDASHTTGGDPAHPGWYGGANHHHDPCDTWKGDATWHNVTACYWDWTHYMDLVNGTVPVQTGTLTGFVLDACCGLTAGVRKPLPGAVVTVQQGGAPVTTTAGADGSYTFTLRPGPYTPTASASGYLTGNHSSVGGSTPSELTVTASQTTWGSILLAPLPPAPDGGFDDAGTAPDSGADAGAHDAGAQADGGFDAGTETHEPQSATSGGCQGAPAGLLGLLGLAALLARRRRQGGL
jgi:MYXO-CTERM domain-containing protein